MKTKSILVMVLAALMLFSFTACEQKVPEFPSEGDVQAAVITSGDTTYLVGDEFDASRYTLTIRFSDGKTETVNGESILTLADGVDLKSEGVKEVEVNYGTTGGLNSVYVTVYEASSVVVTPAVTTYAFDDYSALKGTAVEGTAVVTYGNGQTREFTAIKATADSSVKDPGYGKTAQAKVTVAIANGTESISGEYNVTVTSSTTTDPDAKTFQNWDLAKAISVALKAGEQVYIDDTVATATKKFEVTAEDVNGLSGIASDTYVKLYFFVDGKPVPTTDPFKAEGTYTVYAEVLDVENETIPGTVSTGVTVNDYIESITISAKTGYAPVDGAPLDKSQFTVEATWKSGDKSPVTDDCTIITNFVKASGKTYTVEAVYNGSFGKDGEPVKGSNNTLALGE